MSVHTVPKKLCPVCDVHVPAHALQGHVENHFVQEDTAVDTKTTNVSEQTEVNLQSDEALARALAAEFETEHGEGLQTQIQMDAAYARQLAAELVPSTAAPAEIQGSTSNGIKRRETNSDAPQNGVKRTKLSAVGVSATPSFSSSSAPRHLGRSNANADVIILDTDDDQESQLPSIFEDIPNVTRQQSQIGLVARKSSSSSSSVSSSKDAEPRSASASRTGDSGHDACRFVTSHQENDSENVKSSANRVFPGPGYVLATSAVLPAPSSSAAALSSATVASASTPSTSTRDGERRLQRDPKFTKGILNLLGAAMRDQCVRSKRRTLVALARPTTHFSSDWADVGWACGYRNIQMLCSSLMDVPKLQGRVFDGCPYVPTVFELQKEVERAWSSGFDPIGAAQLGGRVYGTRKWIGTGECCALLRFYGLNAKVVQFQADGQNGASGHHQLIEWVWHYFTGEQPRSGQSAAANGIAVSSATKRLMTASNPVRVTDKPPLYFQHQGHSRTIVGIERRMEKSGEKAFLLVFDPSCPGVSLIRSLTARKGWQSKIKRGLPTLKKTHYQICYVDGLLHPADRERAKTIHCSEVF